MPRLQIDERTATKLGAAFYNPADDGFYAGEIAEAPYGQPVFLGKFGERYAGGVLSNLGPDVQAKIVLEELLGFARPAYVLAGCCVSYPTPELVKTIGVATKGSGQRNVKPLIESKITGSAPTIVKVDCHLNEYHIVIEDKQARQGAWDLLGNYIADGGQEVAHMQNQDIADALAGATTDTGEDWSAVTGGISDYNPMTKVGEVINILAGKGYPATFMAVNGSDWANFLTNTRIARAVQAGLITVGGSVALPGWPAVKVLVDYGITATSAFIGNPKGISLCDGGTEAVKFRDEKKRYTGYIIRQYLDVQIADPDCVRKLTGIS